MKALLVRLDKIGDLICTLPADELLPKEQFQTQWMISHGLDFVPVQSVPFRSFTVWKKKSTLSQFWSFLRFLRQEKFDLAISFQAPWWVSFGLWWSKVPLRVGVKSQWHSFLFLNHGLRQKRSLAVQHEAEYNFDLVKKALSLFPNQLSSHSRDSSVSDSSRIDSATAAKNPTKYNQLFPILKLKAPLVWKRPHDLPAFFVVHPGMAGSAKNWSQKSYIACIEVLLENSNLTCVITGTKADEPYLSDIKTHFATHPRIRILQNQVSARELLDVLAQAEFVFAPSTGVLHLSAALGQKTFGLYSPRRVQHPRRWAARGPHVEIFCPPDSSAENEHCMELMEPASIAHAILRKVK